MRNLAPVRASSNLFGRFVVPVIVLLLAIGAVWWAPARWSLVLWLPLLALAAYDFFQDGHTLWRNYPLVARIRWGMEDLRPYLRSYIVEGDLEGRPFNIDERALIYARAKGQLDAHPFGTELSTTTGRTVPLTSAFAPAITPSARAISALMRTAGARFSGCACRALARRTTASPR